MKYKSCIINALSIVQNFIYDNIIDYVKSFRKNIWNKHFYKCATVVCVESWIMGSIKELIEVVKDEASDYPWRHYRDCSMDSKIERTV